MKRTIALIIAIILLIVLAFNSVAYVVRTDQQAVVLRFGKAIRVIQQPGLYFKLPMADSVVKYTKKLLEYDAAPVTVVTQDKKSIMLDTIALFRITDPLTFYKRVRTVAGAQERLDDSIYSAVRVVIGKHTYDEILYQKRDEIYKAISDMAGTISKEYGVSVEAVMFKRVFIPSENEQAIYQSMIAERQRVAAKLRAEGQSEATRIKSEADRKAKEILADAKRQAEILKGEGDAKAQEIISQAASEAPEFYKFLQTIDFYRDNLKNTTIVLTPDSELFKYLKQMGVIKQ